MNVTFAIETNAITIIASRMVKVERLRHFPDRFGFTLNNILHFESPKPGVKFRKPGGKIPPVPPLASPLFFRVQGRNRDETEIFFRVQGRNRDETKIFFWV